MNNIELANIIKSLSSKTKFKQDVLEKDYYLTIVLNNINAYFGKSIAFKGGTLLNKIYLNYERLSEDLDFTYSGEGKITTRSQRSQAMKPIREKMKQLINDLNFHSNNPKGEGSNNSTQYIFIFYYHSIITGKDEKIKCDISLRNRPVDAITDNRISHFYKNPFNKNENIIEENKIYTLSVNEVVAEKLRCSITRRKKAIRDYYDLFNIYECGFNFKTDSFQKIF